MRRTMRFIMSHTFSKVAPWVFIEALAPPVHHIYSDASVHELISVYGVLPSIFDRLLARTTKLSYSTRFGGAAFPRKRPSFPFLAECLFHCVR